MLQRTYEGHRQRPDELRLVLSRAVYYAELNLACQKQCTILAFVCEEPVELLQSPHIGKCHQITERMNLNHYDRKFES